MVRHGPLNFEDGGQGGGVGQFFKAMIFLSVNFAQTHPPPPPSKKDNAPSHSVVNLSSVWPFAFYERDVTDSSRKILHIY